MDSKINTLSDLHAACEQRKAVVVPSHAAWKKPKPAVFIMNLSGSVLHRLMRAGMFIYTRPESPAS
ncbi:MAG TPA: hypothetical protein VD994_19705 [Prosthecobacter sp.]|nr:hypothetical protein [Prosthecobacter sp.]